MSAEVSDIGVRGDDAMIDVHPQFCPAQVATTPLRLLNPDGTLADDVTCPMGEDVINEALQWMMLSRAFDEKGFSLHRQGRFGTFSPVRGQEASVVGSCMALDPAVDWVVPQYRELPALLRQGFPLERFMMYFMGNPAGGEIPESVNILPIQISLATQLPHAVGLAWGLKLQGKPSVVIVYFGDGASSEGDFHEACNLAGLVKAPIVFMLQNNGWAISTPREKQTAAATFAERAPGYGFPGVLVDGNDLFAVHAVANQAVQRARSGEGPTLIESQTYRMGAHNTADDPTRYIDVAVHERWQSLDPIERVQRYLSGLGQWDEDRARAAGEAASREVERALDVARSFPPPNPDQIFANVYGEMPQRLQQQQATWAADR